MKTRIWKMENDTPQAKAVEEAANLIRHGELVAFPTETVYGLGAHALNAKAVAKIFRAKGRPSDNPLIVHISDLTQLKKIAQTIPPATRKLARLFWPGPLTIVVPKRSVVPNNVTAGLNTVAVRMPSHPIALALIRAAGVPIAAPSANRSTQPSPTRASHVLEDLDGKIAGVIDGGPVPFGIESTVIMVKGHRLVVLRPGALPVEELEKSGFAVELDKHLLTTGPKSNPLSPGMKYRHYAPNARVALFSPKIRLAGLRKIMQQEKKKGHYCAILGLKEWDVRDVVLKRYKDTAQMAYGLFDDFRTLDKLQTDLILVEHVPEVGLGLAVMNRAKKAAGGKRV